MYRENRESVRFVFFTDHQVATGETQSCARSHLNCRESFDAGGDVGAIDRSLGGEGLRDCRSPEYPPLQRSKSTALERGTSRSIMGRPEATREPDSWGSRGAEIDVVQKQVTPQGWPGSTPKGRRPQVRGFHTGGSLAVASSTPATLFLPTSKDAEVEPCPELDRLFRHPTAYSAHTWHPLEGAHDAKYVPSMCQPWRPTMHDWMHLSTAQTAWRSTRMS